MRRDREEPGREIASLAGAFATSGASSLIASLWKVDDASTAILFENFYRSLKAGKRRGEALREAKLSLVKNSATSHPFYWAPFILIGEQ